MDREVSRVAAFGWRAKVQRYAGQGDVPGLVEVLVGASQKGSAHVDRLQAAADALVDLGEGGRAALLDAMRTDPDRISYGWLPELWPRLAGTEAVGRLAAILAEDPVDNVRLAASEVLRMVGSPEAVPAFADAAVADPDSHVRCSAALGLADHEDFRAVPPLVDWVLHGNNAYRGIDGLRRAGDPTAIPFLTELRGHGDQMVRDGVARAINEITAAQYRYGPVPAELEEPVARLEQVAGVLVTLPATHPTSATVVGPGLRQTRAQIPIICATIRDAVVALRSGQDPEGRGISPQRVGEGLAALVSDVSGGGFAGMMYTVLDDTGVRAVQDAILQLGTVADQLRAL